MTLLFAAFLFGAGALAGVLFCLWLIAYEEARDERHTWEIIRDLRRGKRRLRRAIENETRDETRDDTRRENRE